MPLPNTGPLSIGDIRQEFGGAAPDGIDEYYAGGAYVPAGTLGINGPIPSAGVIKIGDFYGAPLPQDWTGQVDGERVYQQTTRWVPWVGRSITDFIGTNWRDSSGSRMQGVGTFTPAIDYKADPNAVMPVTAKMEVVIVTGASSWVCSSGLVPVQGRDGRTYYCLPKTSYEELSLPVGFWHDRGTPRGPTVNNPPQARKSSTVQSADNRFTLACYAPPGNPIRGGARVELSDGAGGTIILPAQTPQITSVTPPTALQSLFPSVPIDVATFVWDNIDLRPVGFARTTYFLSYQMKVEVA